MHVFMVRTFASVCVLVAASNANASDEPRGRLESVTRGLASDWSEVTNVVRNGAASNDERSDAIDRFFAHLGETVSQNGDGVVGFFLDKLREGQAERTEEKARERVNLAEAREKLPEFADSLKAFLSMGSDKVVQALAENPEAPADAADKVRTLAGRLSGLIDTATAKVGRVLDENADKVNEKFERDQREEELRFHKVEDFILRAKNEHQLIPRTELALRLTRDILRLQEERVFALLGPNTDPQARIAAAAEVSRDFMFVARQARAMVKLVAKSADVASRAMARAKLGDERELGRAIAEDLVAPMNEMYPVLIETVNDLGVYYAKLLQTFSGLVFHVDQDAFKQLNYLQGHLPRVVSYQEVKEIVEADLGRSIEDAFLTFERTPFANGTIAQVHRATVSSRKGPREVAVKVVKPYVAEELAWNKRTNDVLFRVLEIIAPEDAKPWLRFVTSQARELGRTFEGELDLGAELQRQREFRRILRPQRKAVSIPRTLARFSGPRVLTTDYVADARLVHEVFPAPTPVKMPIVDVMAKAAKGDATPATDPSTTSTSPADDARLSLGGVFLKLATDHGYEIKPRYFQFVRGIVPLVSINVHLGRRLAALTKDGRDKDDPEVKAVATLMSGLISSFTAQLLYAGEVNADANWGNLLVDPKHHVHQVDWGTTVVTRGLITQPAFLVGAILKGDAALVVRRLGQLGHFRDLEADRANITALVQAYMDQEGFTKRSYFGVLKAYGPSAPKFGRKKKAPVETAAPEAVAETIADPAPEATATADAPAPKPKPELVKVITRVIWPMTKAMVLYPYHRARVRLIRATSGLSLRCDEWLGRE